MNFFADLFNRVFHWGPIIAMCIVNCITYSTLQVTNMWLPIFSTWKATLCHGIFLFFVGATLYNFFCAMFIGPGYVPFGWKPENPDHREYVQYCALCKGYKAPRAHHCRKCRRCVMKMDHHCPWINNCCGHLNHSKFTLFLFSAVCGCILSAIFLFLGLYRAFHVSWYYMHGDHHYIVYLTIYQLAFTVFSFGLALGVIVAVGGLFYVQMKQILKNETNIENWIVIKAYGRRRQTPFIYPYNLGWWRNLKQVFWDPLGNGMTDWPLVPESNQYTLTYEQILQKRDKHFRKKKYTIVENYNGSWFPLSKGIKTCMSPPCSDETRIPLSVGDTVYVTRWRKRWLYGEKCVQSNIPAEEEVKGWFPRCCAVELAYTDCEVEFSPVAETAQHSSRHLTFTDCEEEELSTMTETTLHGGRHLPFTDYEGELSPITETTQHSSRRRR